MMVKPTVDATGVQPTIWYALGRADQIHQKMFGREIVVTSLVDGTHNSGSLHPKGLAADIRIRDLTDTQAQDFFIGMQVALEDHGFDIVFEGGVGATPATTGAHIHVEYDPKGRTFIGVAV